MSASHGFAARGCDRLLVPGPGGGVALASRASQNGAGGWPRSTARWRHHGAGGYRLSGNGVVSARSARSEAPAAAAPADVAADDGRLRAAQQ